MIQRLRVRFSRGEEIKFISHLDIMRLWERAFRRAQIPLAYSEGFSPHPRISLASPLALGITSEAELMDVFITKPATPHWFIAAVSQQLPTGISILQVHPVSPLLPSLQAQVGFAEYSVTVETDKNQKEVESAIVKLLSAEHFPWHHERDTGQKNYDLRTLIDDLWLMESTVSFCTLGMRLRCDSSGSGRPEQVALALGFINYPRSIHRTKLVLKGNS